MDLWVTMGKESESCEVSSLHWSSWSGGEKAESEHLTFTRLLFARLSKKSLIVYIKRIFCSVGSAWVRSASSMKE